MNRQHTPFYGAGEESGLAAGSRHSFYTQRSSLAPAPHREASQLMRTAHHVQEERDKLGIWDRFQFDRESQRIIRRQLGEIMVNLLEAQKQQIIDRLTLELDAVKKKAFLEWLRQNKELEQDIARLSTEYEEDLITFCWEAGERYWKKKKAQISRLEQAMASGQIDDQDCRQEVGQVQEWTGIGRANLNAKIELMLSNHAQQIERTLRVFHERSINGPR